jgi:decaprenylphosphoryl-5-phosphoribose phosphatase
VLAALDLRLFRLLRTRGHALPIENAVLRFSHLGEHGILWLCIALAGFVLDPAGRPHYRHAIRAVLVTYALNTLVKWGIRRGRPVLEDLPPLMPTATQLSYPSAHASTSFAAASALSPVMPSRPLHLTAAAMGVSRPYLGVHYPSDILAGAAFGWALARLVP